jgi:hypothetical protein
MTKNLAYFGEISTQTKKTWILYKFTKRAWNGKKNILLYTVGTESLCRAESLCRNTCISYFRHLELR